MTGKIEGNLSRETKGRGKGENIEAVRMGQMKYLSPKCIFKTYLFLFYFICIGVFPACRYVNLVHTMPVEARRGCWMPGTTGGCASYGFWGLNSAARSASVLNHGAILPVPQMQFLFKILSSFDENAIECAQHPISTCTKTLKNELNKKIPNQER